MLIKFTASDAWILAKNANKKQDIEDARNLIYAIIKEKAQDGHYAVMIDITSVQYQNVRKYIDNIIDILEKDFYVVSLERKEFILKIYWDHFTLG